MNKLKVFKMEMDNNWMDTLVMEKIVPYESESRFDNAEKIVDMMNKVFNLYKQSEEYVYMIALDARCHIRGLTEISHGGVKASYVDPRSVFQKALMLGAVGIIIIHNHPGRELSPSKEDISLTERLVEAGKILGIPIHDHIIIAGLRDYCSMRADGILDM